MKSGNCKNRQNSSVFSLKNESQKLNADSAWTEKMKTDKVHIPFNSWTEKIKTEEVPIPFNSSF